MTDKKDGIVVLSLFDGIGCGYEALKRIGVKVSKYYSSEIDKYAISILKYNHSDVVHLGDINNWESWDIEKPDLIIGGSPCQGFSFAGKQLNFNDERSKLFFKFVDIVNCYKPKYFLLENVVMKKEYQNVISSYLGVEPIKIDSALVSGQSRKRLYWTNIKNILQPIDKNIKVRDILDNEFDKVGSQRGRYLENGIRKDGKGKTKQYLEIRQDDKSNCLTTVCKDNIALKQVGLAIDIKGKDILKRVYSIDGKIPTLTAVCAGHQEKKIALNNLEYRRLMPIEYERLQTLNDNYTEKGIDEKGNIVNISKTRRYKALGNCWTVDVICHILKSM